MLERSPTANPDIAKVLRKQTGTERQKLEAPLTNETRWRVFERDGYKCLWCGYKYDLTADHIEPRSKGGGHGMDNLQTLCRSCNALKNDHQTGPDPMWVLSAITIDGAQETIVKQIAMFDLGDYQQALYAEASRRPLRRHKIGQLLGYAEQHGFADSLPHFEFLTDRPVQT